MPAPVKLIKRRTTSQKPIRDLHGKPGYDFDAQSLADYGYTEIHTVTSDAMPLGCPSTIWSACLRKHPPWFPPMPERKRQE